MRRAITYALGGLVLSATLGAATAFGPAQINDDGSLKIDEAHWAVIHFGGSYATCAQQDPQTVAPLPGYPRQEDGQWLLRASFKTAEGTFTLVERLTKVTDHELRLALEITAEPPVNTGELSLVLLLPVEQFGGRTFEVDGETFTLPTTFREKSLRPNASYRQFTLQGQEFKLRVTGDGELLVQDDRAYKSDRYAVRFGFTPQHGAVASSALALTLHAVPYRTTPLDISAAANRSFTDDVAGDGKGGWTDQGPDNDLRTMSPGLQTLGGIRFDIANAKATGGKACIVLAGDQVRDVPRSASVDAAHAIMKNLCVLHALAWAPDGKQKIGTVTVRYADGTSASFPVVNGVDVGNWWRPTDQENAQVAWRGENRSTYVGLYRSLFPLARKPVAKVEFASAGNAAWMIAAVSAADEDLPKLANFPCYVVANADWKPITFTADVEKGSALDFSRLGLLDAPAGKYGRVIVRDGHFAFEKAPDKPARFYGTNLYFGICFPEKAQAEKLANRLAASGYNAVRFHHFDQLLSLKDAPGKTALDPVKLDRLHYLFKCLKEKGIYVTIDLYTIKSYQDDPKKRNLEKLLMQTGDPALEQLLAFSQNLLTSINPYTGLAWKDDPTLITVSCINEDTIPFSLNFGDGQRREFFTAKFADWLREKGHPEATGPQRERLKFEFIVETHRRTFQKMSAFLRAAGLQTPLTDANTWPSSGMPVIRDQFDYVDMHTYWDHPRPLGKPWSPPELFYMTSAIKMFGTPWLVPADIMPSRLFGKPYTVTEINYCYPNPCRAEGGALAGAYAALQDWDALYCFGYAEAMQQFDDAQCGTFNTVGDPIRTLSERLGKLLFLRGDVTASKLKMPILVNPATVKDALFPHSIHHTVGMLGQVGSIVERDGGLKLPEGMAKPVLHADATDNSEQTLAKLKAAYDFGKGELDLDRRFARSSTGELEIDGRNGFFKVATPRTAVVVTIQGARLSSGILSVDNQKDFATLAVSALDGQAIAESKRLLVLHLTNCLNTMTKFSDKSMTVLENRGGLPLLAKRGVAGLTLKLAPGPTPQIYAIDLAGKRIGMVKAAFSPDGILTFTADTFAFATPCFAYEIVRQPAETGAGARVGHRAGRHEQ